MLSAEEVRKILEAVPNLKHRTILMAVYSGGLRLGEILRLRVSDVMKDQQKIFIKGGKNKKDRYTLLSKQFITILNQYIKAYDPKYWLFEGQTGGQYSASSVQHIFRAATAKADVGHFATLHTLRACLEVVIWAANIHLRNLSTAIFSSVAMLCTQK